LKQKIEGSIKLLYEMYDEFTSSKTKLDLDCNEHFQEIRFQLDQHREELKQKIDDIYMEMIENTKKFEALYFKSLDENLTGFLKSFEIKSVEKELNDIEETFRDPNLLVETIQELNLKQNKAVNSIQLKLNEIVEVKDDIKNSNEFKPFLSFSKDLFGQLNLGQYSSNRFKSKILTEKQSSELIKLCEFGLKDKFKLLYRASETGFHSSQFHSKCDGKPNTLSILKANGFVFGSGDYIRC
jgi:hypothetical protein